MVILLIAALPDVPYALSEEWHGSGTYEIGSGKDWFWISELRTYDDVTVIMYEGGGVNQFSMYDNSELIKYSSSIANLYLYDNAIASLFGGSAPMDIYVDPANTGWIKFYAYDVSYGIAGIHGWWLSDNREFIFDFTGDTYSHVQIVPEPTSILIFGLGALLISLRSKRH
jgi:hypothetical protein